MAKKEFSATEVMMLMEKIQKEFRVVAESVIGLKDRVDALFEMVAKNTEDIEMIKLDMAGMKLDIAGMKLDISSIKAELVEINRKLEQKVDRAEYIRLERRVSVLERKLKIA